MRILAVDVGTGTQDVLLYDSEAELENCVQMVLPSPTLIVAARIRRATAAGEPVLLPGVTMGGGPCAWAADDHIRRGLRVYATADAARTFDDDLARVAQMGVTVVGEDEARRLPAVQRIQLRDFDYDAIQTALAQFGVEPRLDALAIAVFDHGDAPPGVSDRAFRFEYIAATVARSGDGNGLAAFAYRREDIPARLTRMIAVSRTAPAELPLLVMDTGPAAVLGTLEDPAAREAPAIVANLGNFHTLAFHIGGRPNGGNGADGSEHHIHGLFEHHTGELTRERLEKYLRQLAEGTITNAEVFADKGHGALVISRPARAPERLVVVGPRRALLAGSPLRPYFAVPHGAMMLAGCFGLLRAAARTWPRWAADVEAGLGK